MDFYLLRAQVSEHFNGTYLIPFILVIFVLNRDRPIIGFTDLFNRYQYRLIGLDTHHIGIGKNGIGIGWV